MTTAVLPSPNPLQEEGAAIRALLPFVLGTAQFGLDYGVANRDGRVAPAAAAEILALAKRSGISILDTAPSYGVAENVLGQLAGDDRDFDFITKTLPAGSESLDDEVLTRIERAFADSLHVLRRERVAGILVHHAEDLLKPGGDRLFERLQTWQDKGRVDKIGVSVYERAELEAIFERYPLNLVQLPLNVFDQRLHGEGVLAELSRRGVEIHVRSVFLQGLLLMDEALLPAYFAPWRDHLRRFHDACREMGATPLAACLAFVRRLGGVTGIVTGVVSVAQLQQCLDAWQQDVLLDWSAFAVRDPGLVDPRRWPARS